MSPVWLVALLGAGPAGAPSGCTGGPLAAAIETACARTVKLYGGTIGRVEGYGSGVIVSPDGYVVTARTALLEARRVRVVLADGRRLTARVVREDPLGLLALLRVDADGLPAFPLSGSAHLRPGDALVAAANVFKVADGPEPVSVAAGVFSGRAELAGYSGKRPVRAPEVLLTDMIVSAPGAAGGALVDAEGQLVGVIGPPVVSVLTGTWVNYAVPVEYVAALVGGTLPDEPEAPPAPRDAQPVLAALGLRLLDIGAQHPPAYVERVRYGSPAWQAGLRDGDLLVAVEGRRIADCAAAHAALAALRPGRPAELVIQRGSAVHRVVVTVPESQE